MTLRPRFSWIPNVALVVASTAIALVLGELTCRLLLDPVDVLEPELVHHEILGRAVRPNTGGHDSWGFRNAAVPDDAEIVAIGDSMTYGNSASAEDSWPAVLARRSGRSVYNLAQGGLGPVQYAYLFETKALALSPDLVIVGFYPGNDLKDAFLSADRLALWETIRGTGLADVPTEGRDSTEGRSARIWLARHSLLYGRVVRWSVDRVRDRMQREDRTGPADGIEPGSVAARTDPATTESAGERARRRGRRNPRDGRRTGPQSHHGDSEPPRVWFVSEEHDVEVSLAPGLKLRAQTLEDPTRVEGLATALELIGGIGRDCRQRGIGFAVVLIPTRELVLAPLYEDDPGVRQAETLRALLANERRILETARETLARDGFRVVEPLEELRGAIGRERIFGKGIDDHYLAPGYRVIGEVVAREIANGR